MKYHRKRPKGEPDLPLRMRMVFQMNARQYLFIQILQDSGQWGNSEAEVVRRLLDDSFSRIPLEYFRQHMTANSTTNPTQGKT